VERSGKNSGFLRVLGELHRDLSYLMMRKGAWVAGADRREAPGPKPEHLGRRLRLRHQPPRSWQLLNGGDQRGVSKAGAATCLEKSEKREVQAARNAPSEDSKCWQCVELGIHGLRSWGRNLSRKVRETRSSSSQKRSEPAAHPCRGPGGQAGDEHGEPSWFKGTRGRGQLLCGTNISLYKIHFH